jgi:hypothetical protein
MKKAPLDSHLQGGLAQGFAPRLLVPLPHPLEPLPTPNVHTNLSLMKARYTLNFAY